MVYVPCPILIDASCVSQIVPEDSLGFLVSVARGAAVLASHLARHPTLFKFYEQSPRDIRVRVKPTRSSPAVSSRVIMPRGTPLDTGYRCNQYLANPRLENLGPDRDTILSVAVAEGESDDFDQNNLIGHGRISYESIKSALNGATTLRERALCLKTETTASSRGRLEVVVDVEDVDDHHRYLTSTSMEFIYSGCLAPNIQNPIVEAGLMEMWSQDMKAATTAMMRARGGMLSKGGELSPSASEELNTALVTWDVEKLWAMIPVIEAAAAGGITDQLYDFGDLDDLSGCDDMD